MESGRFRKKKVNFSMVSNQIIRNPEISLKAKGLYALIQSYITIEDFILYKGFLKSKCREGREAFESAWQELKKSGYLVQYRMQDETTKKFFWEYELLDDVEPYPEKPYDGSRVTWEKDNTENGGDNSNTDKNNTEKNKSNLIISADDVMDQIGYITFSEMDKSQVEQIALLMVDVLNMSDDTTIRIGKVDRPIQVVKSRLMKINKFHIEYVLTCLKQNTNKIANIRNYLLTTLFNAPTSIDSFYQNQVNHDLYG